MLKPTQASGCVLGGCAFLAFHRTRIPSTMHPKLTPAAVCAGAPICALNTSVHSTVSTYTLLTIVHFCAAVCAGAPGGPAGGHRCALTHASLIVVRALCFLSCPITPQGPSLSACCSRVRFGGDASPLLSSFQCKPHACLLAAAKSDLEEMPALGYHQSMQDLPPVYFLQPSRIWRRCERPSQPPCCP